MADKHEILGFWHMIVDIARIIEASALHSKGVHKKELGLQVLQRLADLAKLQQDGMNKMQPMLLQQWQSSKKGRLNEDGIFRRLFVSGRERVNDASRDAAEEMRGLAKVLQEMNSPQVMTLLGGAHQAFAALEASGDAQLVVEHLRKELPPGMQWLLGLQDEGECVEQESRDSVKKE